MAVCSSRGPALWLLRTRWRGYGFLVAPLGGGSGKKNKRSHPGRSGKGRRKSGPLRPLPGTELPGTEARKGRPLTADLPGDRPAFSPRVRPLSWRILDSTFWFAATKLHEVFPEFFCIFWPLKANLSALRPSCAHLTLCRPRESELLVVRRVIYIRKSLGPCL